MDDTIIRTEIKVKRDETVVHGLRGKIILKVYISRTGFFTLFLVALFIAQLWVKRYKCTLVRKCTLPNLLVYKDTLLGTIKSAWHFKEYLALLQVQVDQGVVLGDHHLTLLMAKGRSLRQGRRDSMGIVQSHYARPSFPET